MSDLIEYARENQESVATKPLGIIDGLIFSQLAYINFGAVVPELRKDKVSVSLDFFASEAAKKSSGYPKMFEKILAGKKAERLLAAVANNPRYREIKLNYYVEEFDPRVTKQFSGVTFLVSEQETWVSFRGTNDELVGWEEDFNLTFSKTIPAQKEAERYLKKVARKTSGALFVVGHSKGGTIGTYGALALSGYHKKRLGKIFNFDGPGLNLNWWDKWQLRQVRDKYIKILPQSSIVGLLLEQSRDYLVIKSKRLGVMQHEAYSWLIKNDNLVYLPASSRTIRRFSHSFNSWLKKKTRKEREFFFQIFFNILEKAGVDEVSDLAKVSPKKLSKIWREAQDLDPKAKVQMMNMLKSLMQNYRETKTDF